jgi:hypothetical protein
MYSTPFDSFFEDYSIVVRGATETTREAVLHMFHYPAEGRMVLQVYDVATDNFTHEFTSVNPADVKSFFTVLADFYSWEPPVWLIENVEIYLTLLPQSFYLNGGIWNEDDTDTIGDIEAFYFPAINPVFEASIAATSTWGEDWKTNDFSDVGGTYSAERVTEVVEVVTAYRDAALLHGGPNSTQAAAEADAFLAKVAAL